MFSIWKVDLHRVVTHVLSNPVSLRMAGITGVDESHETEAKPPTSEHCNENGHAPAQNGHGKLTLKFGWMEGAKYSRLQCMTAQLVLLLTKRRLKRAPWPCHNHSLKI